MATLAIQENANIPVGSIRTIGEFGNPYLVSNKTETDDNGEILVEIEFLESGRKDYYPLNEILLDPEAV
ncbi:Uncharacterised protein [Moraxella lacunata]|uniref:Uncharacterized protein n=1 Tax=Moraxella lacunata TaxID=477 RepID=A0A378UC32_MORLA|nr:DUF5397 family protein [Moraxella lacunata]STZ74948.1 Uncharacterised protein [Moraxella lacunata]